VICETFPTEVELAAALAGRIASALRDRPTLVLGLPTGRTPLALYAELRRLSAQEGMSWSRARTFNLDEFVGLGPANQGSYRSFMEDRLFRHIDITRSNIGFLDGHARDLGAECARYEREIAGAGGLDLVILGIGVNGHIGFNEPADALVSQTHVVTLDQPTRAANALWFDGDTRRVPSQALTMGMATIMRARTVVLIATGDAKGDAVKAMLEGGLTTRVPASFLQLHPKVTVMLDEAAADDLAACR